MAGKIEISVSDIGELIGRHLDRMSVSVNDAGSDVANLDQEMMMLDGLSYPFLKDNEEFREEWENVPGITPPHGVNGDIHRTERRWKQFRAYMVGLVDERVLAKSKLASWDAAELE